MLLDRLFRPRPARAIGQALYQRVVDQSRTPALYADIGAPDTVEGRFEIYTLHAVLLIERLRGHGEQAAEVSQALFDAYVKSLDHALREMGVGDLSVGKKMRKLGESLYGRMSAYEGPLRAEDVDALAAAVAKNVYESADAATGLALARYAVVARQNLAQQSFEAVSRAPAWAEIAA